MHMIFCKKVTVLYILMFVKKNEKIYKFIDTKYKSLLNYMKEGKHNFFGTCAHGYTLVEFLED